MTNFQKILFLGVVPIAAAGLGAFATYYGAPEREQIFITGEAANAAKDGKLTIEIIRKDEGDGNGMIWLIGPLIVIGFAGMVWAATRS